MANTSYKNKKEESREEDLEKIQEEEREYWKEFAELMTGKYRDMYLKSPLYTKELNIIKTFIDPKKGEKWLDVGCGALAATEVIWEQSKGEIELWAGDIYLEPAKKRLEELNNPPIKLEYIDLSKKLPFPDNFFDGIVASKVLTYVTDFEGKKGKDALRGIFQELFRILKPQGVLVWGTPKKNANPLITAIYSLSYIFNPYMWIKRKYFIPFAAVKLVKFFKATQDKEKEGIYTYLSQDEYEDLLSEIGFKSVKWNMSLGGQILVNKSIKTL